MLGLPLTGLLILGIDGDHHFNTLPYYTDSGTIEKWTERAQRVEPFSLINHEDESFDSKELEGKVWIAAFFSHECATRCPVYEATALAQLSLPR
jgi:cytochrome oxidase Cu insertion factor (SCO1/SenC/PrrC family)